MARGLTNPLSVVLTNELKNVDFWYLDENDVEQTGKIQKVIVNPGVTSCNITLDNGDIVPRNLFEDWDMDAPGNFNKDKNTKPKK